MLTAKGACEQSVLTEYTQIVLQIPTNIPPFVFILLQGPLQPVNGSQAQGTNLKELHLEMAKSECARQTGQHAGYPL